jgi:putative ABC transport system permease protein
MIVSGEWLRHRLRELVVDRGRVLLVVLGILWGALSLTVVLSFGQGFHTAITAAIWASGHNLLRLSTGMTAQPHAGLPAGQWIRLVPEDAPLLQKRVQGVRSISIEFRSPVDSLEYRGRQINTWTHGVDACYGEMRSLQPLPGGRFLNEQDASERRRVVFLGNLVKERLFGDAPAVGERIKLRGVPFTVVGVLRPKVTMSDYNGADAGKVFIPASTFQALRGSRYLSYMIVELESPGNDLQAVRDIRTAMGERHRFDPADIAALDIWNQIAEDRRTMGIVDATQVLMGIVGVLGLLVALIGVANVMYVLVEERRREIGIQMALGARPSILLAGFFFEGLALTFTGGILGLALSAGVLRLFNGIPLDATARAYLGKPEVSLATAALVTVFLGIAGCAAGYFPARRAANLDPVTALREE